MLDLVAINIQRGRDHGLPGYSHYRQKCGGGDRAETFSDFQPDFSAEATVRLADLFRHPDDVDLFVGLYLEQHCSSSSSAILGPTTLCIVGDQFARLKKGDRYFYDLEGQPGSFTGGTSKTVLFDTTRFLGHENSVIRDKK